MAVKKHIFLVEDELHLRLTLSLILRKAGFRVSAAEDGSKALKMLQKLKEKSEEVDLLVTDIQMPGLTGLDIIDGIGKMNMKIPCLVITGYGNKDTVIRLMRKGCSEYLDKPFDPDEFLKRVNIVLEKEELKNAERKKQVKKIEDEKFEIKREIEAYKQNFGKLRQQVDLAVGAYRNLVEIDEDNYKIPVAYRYKPFAELGGDFLDIRDTETGCDILLADVAGHDMGASFHVVMVKALFEENCCTGCDGQSFFEHLNKQLIDHSKDKRMVTGLFLRLNIESMRGEIVTAGHPPVIAVTPGKEPELLNPKGDVLGIFEDAAGGYSEFDIVPGERFFLYTDGIINACRVDGPSGNRQKLKRDGLDSLINGYTTLPLKDVIARIWEDVCVFCRHKPTDDMLILGVEIPGYEHGGNNFNR
jgi:DNA-binding response OmpR family regulator